MTSSVPFTEDLLKGTLDNEIPYFLASCSLIHKWIITSSQLCTKGWKDVEITFLSEAFFDNVTGVSSRLCEAPLPS